MGSAVWSSGQGMQMEQWFWIVWKGGQETGQSEGEMRGYTMLFGEGENEAI